MKVRVVLAARRSERLLSLLESRGGLVVRVVAATNLTRTLGEEDFDLLVAERACLGSHPPRRIAAVRALPGMPEVVVVAEREDAAERAGLLASGVLGVLNAGLDDETLGATLGALLARRRDDLLRHLRGTSEVARSRLSDFATLSPAMRRLVDTARRVIPSGSSVLVLGETGVGKEWLARAIHNEGPRSSGPFVAVNCGALPESLLESELFGHEKGAFTGAIRAHRGHFEVAHQGTLFLDEIGEMPPHLQVKLLRVLQEHRVQRVGSERSLDVDLRVMAATNRSPLEEIARGRLREDLYYRLAVVTLTVPPLRQRLEDLPALADAYRERFAGTFRRDVRGIGPDAMQALLAYPWPGNLREMINVVERAVLLASGPEIVLSDLPEEIARAALRPSARPPDGAASPDETLSFAEARRRALGVFERDYLAKLLERSGGRVGEAAGRAGVAPRTLYGLMRRHGLRKEDFKFAGR